MNEILAKMFLAALIQSVKNPDKKAKLRMICRDAFHAILLAYADDPTFLDDEQA